MLHFIHSLSVLVFPQTGRTRKKLFECMITGLLQFAEGSIIFINI